LLDGRTAVFCMSIPGGSMVAFSVVHGGEPAGIAFVGAADQAALLASIWAFRSGAWWRCRVERKPNSSKVTAASMVALMANPPVI